jgi:hypothetical protein
MITNLYMKNVRGIAEGQIQDLTQVNIFVGPNNSGKTTVLEALYLAATADVGCKLYAKSSEGGEVIPVTVTADLDLLGLAPMARIWQRHNLPPQWRDAPEQWDSAEGRIEFFGIHDILSKYQFLADKKTKTGFVEGDEQLTALLRVQKVQDQIPPFPSFVKEYLDEEAESRKNRHFVLLWHPPFTFNRNGIAGWYVDGHIPAAAQTLFYDFHTTHEHFTQAFVERGYQNTHRWQWHIGNHFARVFDLPTDPVPYVSFSPYPPDPYRYDILVEQTVWQDGLYRPVGRRRTPCHETACSAHPIASGCRTWTSGHGALGRPGAFYASTSIAPLNAGSSDHDQRPANPTLHHHTKR